MKPAGIVCAIAFVALVYGLDRIHAQERHSAEIDESDDSEEERCEPGATKMDECNHCYCAGDGWACGRMLCIPGVTHQVDPQPEENKPLNRALRQLDESDPDDSCVPNSTFKMQCNTCFCSSDGHVAGCTLRFCTD